MRLVVVAAIACTWGCTFQPGTFGDNVAVGDPAFAPDAGASAATPDSPPFLRTCAFADPTLRLCLDFEDHAFVPRATDASAMRLDATTHDIAEASRDGSIAALVAPISGIQVPEASALDFTQALTVELWVRPAYDQFATLVNNANEYSVTLTSDHRAGCTLPGGVVVTESDKVDTGSWSHIACSYGPSHTISIYVNGQLKGTTAVAGTATSSAGTSGTKIASGYGGRIDDVKMYARELSADEICAHSGHTDCTE